MNDGKICVSVCASNTDELIERIKRAAELADVIEIRFDKLDFAELEKTLEALKKIKKKIAQPLLAAMHKTVQTCAADGLSIPATGEVWEKIILADVAEMIDLYQGGTLAVVLESWNAADDWLPHFKPFMENVKKSLFICSFHDFNGLPDDLEKNYQWMKKTPAGVLKFAVQADDVTDALAVWKLLQKAKAENKKIIPIAMGESGKWTRILSLAHGAFMTYAALDAGSETAPGQVSARDLTEVYRAKELNAETKVYGIVGGNTGYSMSPYIHNAAFKFHHLNSVFVPLQVQNLDAFMRRMVKPETREMELNFRGFAVTIPHKQEIIKHLDAIDETARKIGAVNTVKIENGKLFGFNTDAQGFVEPLRNAYGDLKAAEVAVFGAGGAARACVYALKTAGAKVTIFARDAAKAENLANEFEARGAKFKAPNESYGEFDIIVNATPLGTKGEPENETPAVAAQIERVKLVYDLIYNPFETRLMKEAKSVFVPTLGGLSMLIAQAMAQQKIWTELDAPMKEMSAAALRRLS